MVVLSLPGSVGSPHCIAAIVPKTSINLSGRHRNKTRMKFCDTEVNVVCASLVHVNATWTDKQLAVALCWSLPHCHLMSCCALCFLLINTRMLGPSSVRLPNAEVAVDDL